MCDEPEQGISLPIPSVSLRGVTIGAAAGAVVALCVFVVMDAWPVLVVLAVLAVAVVLATRWAARFSLVRVPVRVPVPQRERAAKRVTVHAALGAPPKAIEGARTVPAAVVLTASLAEAGDSAAGSGHDHASL